MLVSKSEETFCVSKTFLFTKLKLAKIFNCEHASFHTLLYEYERRTGFRVCFFLRPWPLKFLILTTFRIIRFGDISITLVQNIYL